MSEKIAALAPIVSAISAATVRAKTGRARMARQA